MNIADAYHALYMAVLVCLSGVPWQYGEEAATYMAKFLNAKHRLMPYLYNLVSVTDFSCRPHD